MSKRLIILGTGGNAYDVLDIVEAVNSAGPSWHVAGFLDDCPPPNENYLGFPLLGGLRDAGRHSDAYFISTIRNEQTFQRMNEILALTDVPTERFATLVHPGACISSRCSFGHGVYVNAGVSIAGGVTVGNHVSFGAGCIVGHNAMIGECTIVAPGAVLSGSVHVCGRSYIGARAVIRQRLRVGVGALVGMGAVVVRDVADGITVAGNPARPLIKPTVARIHADERVRVQTESQPVSGSRAQPLYAGISRRAKENL